MAADPTPPPTELPPHPVGNIIYRLGNHPTPKGRVSAPRMASTTLIPESDWVEFDLRDQGLPLKVKNQNPYGACNGHAAASSMEAALWLAGFDEYRPLSAWFVYSILCNGWDVGSNIGEALQLLAKQGTCEETFVPWGTINPRRLTADAKANAAKYKVEIGAAHDSFASIMSATQRRQVSNVSLNGTAMANYGTDSEGRIPAGAGTGNHALGVGFGAKKIGGLWYILGINSWDTGWGTMKGFFWFGQSNIVGQRNFDGYVVKAVVDVPGDPTNPPVVIA
jgi:hypothetical protein